MKRTVLFLLLAALALSPIIPANAGWNPLTVATEGQGIGVYTSNHGGKQVGILYNGFQSSLSLEPVNGLYSCNLTAEYTVWLNHVKAEKRLPKEWNEGSVNDAALAAQMPCALFLGEVTQEAAPLYSTPGHKRLSARHAPGTLALVCGAFGDDYYVTFGDFSLNGFMPKSALKKVKNLSIVQSESLAWGIETAAARTVYTGGGDIMRSGSATLFSDSSTFRQLRDGEQVTVLTTVGDMAQLAGGGFIETRFLEQNGDHSRVYATVKSDQPLDRLNVRSYASKEAPVICKLCAGAKVQIINHTDEWAAVFVTGETGGESYSGVVQMSYLTPDGNPAVNGCARVRTVYDLTAGNGGNWYRLRWADIGYGGMPAGTELTVIGVEGHYDADLDYPDRLLCLTKEGRLITLLDDGVLEPIQSTGIQAKAASNVRMRSAPDKTAASIATISKGQKVEVLLRAEGWTMVKYRGETGYIMSRYLIFP